MNARRSVLMMIAAFTAAGVLSSGCAVNFYKQNPRSKQTIQQLRSKVDELEAARRAEQDRFLEVKEMLERKLKGQIDNNQVSLKMSEGSLVIVLSDDILFDSGKAELKKESFPILDKVAAIIVQEVPNKNIGVGGHTDNVPIKYSGWKSNWELSATRSTNVLHYLEKKGIPAARLSATGYGEYRPAASNGTPEGRAQNRRVEISILPEFLKKKAAPGEVDPIK